MRRKYKRFMTALLIFTMCFIMIVPKALGAETSTVEIPVTVTLTGFPPDIDEDFEIVLKANDSVYPMPAGGANGVYEMIITGAATAKLPEIKFSTLGIYSYTISQKAGIDELCTYDESVYNVKVYITNAGDGSGLESTVIAYKTRETDKIDKIEFVNDYEIEIPEEEIPGGPTDPPSTDPPSTEPPSTNPPDAPKTGDDTVIWPYIALFIAAIAVILFLTLTGRKKKIE